jgi:Ca2+-dependent lipid-binding protein
MKPFAEPVDMFDRAILSVSGARDLSRADLFGKSDPFVVLSWASTNLNAGKEKEIGLTSAIQQTLDPDWKDEDFLMQVYCQITPVYI